MNNITGGSNKYQYGFPDNAMSCWELGKARGFGTKHIVLFERAWLTIFGTELIPEGCKDLQDVFEYHNTNFGDGNIIKAIYRMGRKNPAQYELEKVLFFSERAGYTDLIRLAKVLLSTT